MIELKDVKPHQGLIIIVYLNDKTNITQTQNKIEKHLNSFHPLILQTSRMRSPSKLVHRTTGFTFDLRLEKKLTTNIIRNIDNHLKEYEHEIMITEHINLNTEQTNKNLYP